MVMGHFREHW